MYGDARRLAAELKARGLPGARSMTAIKTLRRERANRQDNARVPTLDERLTRHLVHNATAEILRRGGETTIDGEFGRTALTITDRDPMTRMMLLSASGWRHYSRRFGNRRASLAYLCGRDDAGPWAMRVPGTITTVQSALAWITPATVTDAIQRGRRVARQGDLYAVETTAAHDSSGDLPPAHRWDPETRTLTHVPEDGRAHAPLVLPYPVRFVRQRVYAMGRGGGRADGD